MINNEKNAGAMFVGNQSFKEVGAPGGMHDTLVCNHDGLVNCHTTVNSGGGTVMRDTHYGQTRLTDFFKPDTGQVIR